MKPIDYVRRDRLGERPDREGQMQMDPPSFEHTPIVRQQASPIAQEVTNVADRLAETARREAQQRRTVADAAAAQLAQASDAVSGLVTDIDYFETLLKPDEEARIVIIGGPAGTTIFPESVTPIGADRIRYEGFDDVGCRVTVVQHVSQLNVMLKAVRVGEGRARRIGFHAEQEDE